MQSVVQAPPAPALWAHQRASFDDQSAPIGFARRGPAICAPSPPSLRSGGPPSREHSGGHSKASFAR
ncbi:hypothetical protein BD309DRAFT_961460 [Dichomitus squalens]|nr:hypothetical protein BD309DRAFT_961460 [Dichomitus squalens]